MFKQKFNFVVILLICCDFYLVDTSRSQRYIGNAICKDYPGMCFYNETRTPIKIGSTLRPTTECVEIYCREDYVLHLEFCPFHMLPEGCKVAANKGAEYPHCCAKITCP